MLTHDPDVVVYGGGGINHTDHRAAGIAAVDAVYPAARNPMAFPWLARDGLAPHRVRRIYLFWSERAGRVGRHLGDVLAPRRRAARPRLARSRIPAGLEERMRGWAAEQGANIGTEAAEGFRVAIIDEDEDRARSR